MNNLQNTILDELDVAPETAKRAIGYVIETAIRQFYRTPDCRVDMDTGTANIVFHMPQHKRIIEKLNVTSDLLEHDILPVTLAFAKLPTPVKITAESLFRDLLNDMKTEDDFSMWKKQVRRIVDGVILGRYSDYVEVDIKGAVGILKREAWTPGEVAQYRRGNILFFYVSSVKRLQAGIYITLSRSSIRLPALIFKANLPMHRFVCQRRFVGQKSIVYTDASVRDRDIVRVRGMVSRELNGEIMELRSFR
jgi:hypothetical protein